jgi:predicted small metal-binding protein
VSDDLEARCDCGWYARGPEEDLVPRIQEHARDAHGLEVTREQALAQARPADPDAN